MSIRKYINELESINSKIIAYYKSLALLQASLEKRVTQLYHDFEVCKDLQELEAKSEELQSVLRKRRLVKYEIYDIHSYTAVAGVSNFHGKLAAAKERLRKNELTRVEYTMNWEIGTEELLSGLETAALLRDETPLAAIN